MTTRPLIFLDIDGVLWSWVFMQSTLDNKVKGKEKYIDPAVVKLLDKFVKELDCGIILSSTWRRFNTLEEVSLTIFNATGLSITFEDKTPYLNGEQRGNEVYKWLKDNDELDTPFVVFDDDGDMDKVRNCFIKVDHRFPMDDYHFKCAKTLLHNQSIRDPSFILRVCDET